MILLLNKLKRGLPRAKAFNFTVCHSVCFVGYSQQKRGETLTKTTCIYNMVKISTAMTNYFGSLTPK